MLIIYFDSPLMLFYGLDVPFDSFMCTSNETSI